jgi:hypothetical protein
MNKVTNKNSPKSSTPLNLSHPKFKEILNRETTSQCLRLIKNLEEDERAEAFLFPVDYQGNFKILKFNN